MGIGSSFKKAGLAGVAKSAAASAPAWNNARRSAWLSPEQTSNRNVARVGGRWGSSGMSSANDALNKVSGTAGGLRDGGAFGGGTATAAAKAAGSFASGTTGTGKPITTSGTDLLGDTAQEKVVADLSPGLNDNKTTTSTTFSAEQGSLNENRQDAAFDAMMQQSGTPTYSAQQFDDARGSGLAADASGFYDFERDDMLRRLNAEARAKGMGGSSRALETNMQGLARLGAEEAKYNAEYGLQRQDMLGRLAGQADSSSNARFSTLGNLAGGADQFSLGRFDALLGGAAEADKSIGNEKELLGSLAAGADASNLAANTLALNAVGAQGDRYAGLSGDAQGRAQDINLAMTDAELSMYTGAPQGLIAAYRSAVESGNTGLAQELGTLIGGAAGMYFGGPGGAAAGASAGGWAGRVLDES